MQARPEPGARNTQHDAELAQLYDEARDYLGREYENIFTGRAIAAHYKNYIEIAPSEAMFAMTKSLLGLQPGQRLIDLGCGFGTFVLVARRGGIAAEGLDLGEFQIDFARRRLALEDPVDDPLTVYHRGDAQASGLQAAAYDAVTVWNLLEHVPDAALLIGEAHRLLKPGGLFLGIAPNYLAFRREAHYQLPWLPLLPRHLAHSYLKLAGRDPSFFDNDIHYVTNHATLRALRQAGFSDILDPLVRQCDNAQTMLAGRRRDIVMTAKRWHLYPLLRAGLAMRFNNPFRSVVYFVARKTP